MALSDKAGPCEPLHSSVGFVAPCIVLQKSCTFADGGCARMAFTDRSTSFTTNYCWFFTVFRPTDTELQMPAGTCVLGKCLPMFGGSDERRPGLGGFCRSGHAWSWFPPFADDLLGAFMGAVLPRPSTTAGMLTILLFNFFCLYVGIFEVHHKVQVESLFMPGNVDAVTSGERERERMQCLAERPRAITRTAA